MRSSAYANQEDHADFVTPSETWNDFSTEGTFASECYLSLYSSLGSKALQSLILLGGDLFHTIVSRNLLRWMSAELQATLSEESRLREMFLSAGDFL